MIVYSLTSRTSGKSYVGKTIRALDQRWREHVYHAMNDSTEMPLYAAIRKYGSDDFTKEVLAEAASEEELNELEVRNIAELGTFVNGYNATRGGDGISGYRHTSETKKRFSEMRKGSGNHNWGGLSEEHGRNMARAKVGIGTGPRPHAMGWHHTNEAKEKISKNSSSQPRTPISVRQLDSIGQVLATYPSMSLASQAVGGRGRGIKACCEGRQGTYLGYRWEFANPKR